MSMVFILLPLALLIAGGMLLVFIWATRSGQFDDLETPARRMLHDDEPARSPTGGPAAAKGSREGG